MATRSSILALETPMDRGAWQAAVHRISQSWTQLKWPSTHVICIKLGVYVCTPFFHPLALCIWRSTTLSWNKLSLFVWCCETVLGVVNPKLSFQRNIKIVQLFSCTRNYLQPTAFHYYKINFIKQQAFHRNCAKKKIDRFWQDYRVNQFAFILPQLKRRFHL